MDREINSAVIIFHPYIIDDGWNLPTEVVEEIEYKVKESCKTAYQRVCREYEEHRGKWLTLDVAEKYEAKSWIFRVMEDNRYAGMVRVIGEELQREYGVTELEAINIMNGCHVQDYVYKYYRIRNKIPVCVNEQAICNEVAEAYLRTAI